MVRKSHLTTFTLFGLCFGVRRFGAIIYAKPSPDIFSRDFPLLLAHDQAADEKIIKMRFSSREYQKAAKKLLRLLYKTTPSEKFIDVFVLKTKFFKINFRHFLVFIIDDKIHALL